MAKVDMKTNLNVAADEVWKRKSSDPVCDQCVSQGLARYYHEQRLYTPTEKLLPPGGGLGRIALNYDRHRIKHKWKSAQRALTSAIRIRSL